MANLVIAVLATGILAIVFHAWLRNSEGRRAGELRAWADSAGWRAEGTKPTRVEGERDGFQLSLDWVTNEESLSTVPPPTGPR